MFRVSRTRRSDEPWVRMLVFVIGAVLGLAGILFDITWLVTLAIVVLGAGMVLGIVARRRVRADDDDGHD